MLQWARAFLLLYYSKRKSFLVWHLFAAEQAKKTSCASCIGWWVIPLILAICSTKGEWRLPEPLGSRTKNHGPRTSVHLCYNITLIAWGPTCCSQKATLSAAPAASGRVGRANAVQRGPRAETHASAPQWSVQGGARTMGARAQVQGPRTALPASSRQRPSTGGSQKKSA